MTKQEFIKLMENNGMKFDDTDECCVEHLPQTPPPALIESMCYRYDHAHGIEQYKSDGFKWRVETPEEFEMRQEGNRRIMRQLYEEVAGYGFYKPETDNEG
jgi:hypothetical protein